MYKRKRITAILNCYGLSPETEMDLNLDIKAACEKDFSLRKEFERRSPNTKYSYADMS